MRTCSKELAYALSSFVALSDNWGEDSELIEDVLCMEQRLVCELEGESRRVGPAAKSPLGARYDCGWGVVP